MSSVLKIIHSFSIVTRGIPLAGRQGDVNAEATDPVEITVLGECIQIPFTCPTGDALVLYDASTDDPTTFVYSHFVADQNAYLQRITANGQSTDLVTALVPFPLPGSTCKLDASTTALDGASTPVLVATSKIVVANRSGSPMHGVLFLCK